MLSYLRVGNFQLIENIELELKPGFTVFSGETGVGKSTLLEALSFGLGGRGTADYVGPNGDELCVELQWQEAGTDSIVVQRRYQRDGRGVIKLNGSLISLAELESTFQSRVLRQDQGQAWLLKKPDYPRQLLDDYGRADIAPLRTQYETVLSEMRAGQRQREQLEQQVLALEKDAEFIEHQFLELESFFAQGINEEQLLQKRQRLLNASRLQEHAGEAVKILESIEEQRYGLQRQLENLRQDLQDPQWLAEAAAGLETYLTDLRRGLASLGEEAGVSEDNLEEIERHLQGLRQLRRKYGAELALAFAKVRQDVQLLRDGRNQLRAFTENGIRLQQALRSAGLDLTQTRIQWGKRLATALKGELKKLGFSHSQFKVAFNELAEPDSHGFDQVQFLFSANPDIKAQPLRQVASGGELSRLLLAFYVVLGSSGAQTLIFDEVDIGLGGKTATLVGEHLRRLSQSCQILAVTHLPQVAAQGGFHVHMSKTTAENHTVLEAKAVSGSSRELVLAQMLGSEGEGTAIKHAKELLKIWER